MMSNYSSTFSLSRMFGQATEAIRKDALISTIVFPKTSSLENDEPQEHLEVDTLDYDYLEKYVEKCPELIALNAVSDITLVLQVLKEIHDIMHIDQFDCVQIYRGGVDLIRIRLKNNTTKRSVYVEINEYRRRLQHLLYPEKNDNILVSIVVGALAALLVTIISRKI